MEVADKKGFWALSRLVTTGFPIRATFFQNFQNRANRQVDVVAAKTQMAT
jgi:hypothetical protein